MNDQTTPTLDEAVARMNAGMAALRVALDALLPLTERCPAPEPEAPALRSELASQRAEVVRLTTDLEEARRAQAEAHEAADRWANAAQDDAAAARRLRARIAELEAAQGGAAVRAQVAPSTVANVVDTFKAAARRTRGAERLHELHGSLGYLWSHLADEDRGLTPADLNAQMHTALDALLAALAEIEAAEPEPVRSDLDDFPVGYTIGCAVPGCRVEWTAARVADGSWRAEADANPRKMKSSTPGTGYPDRYEAISAAVRRAVHAHDAGRCACEPGADPRGETWTVALAADGMWEVVLGGKHAVRVGDAPVARVEGLDVALETARARAAEARP